MIKNVEAQLKKALDECERLRAENKILRQKLEMPIGLYPLLADETCWFLAADFDKANWLEDARSFLQVCREYEVDCLLERSRSGKGGHIWIFFESPIAVSLARRLGSFLLTKTMEKRHQVGLDSYDRLFPNQDTMPKGGFGNLIALSLQREPRSRGNNSVFIDENGNLYEDQWAILAQVRKITENQVHKILAVVAFHTEVGEIPLISDEDETPIKPWEKQERKSRKIKEPFPEKVRITLANMVYVEKNGLPSCGDEFPDHVAVPRGCLNEIVDFLEDGQRLSIQEIYSALIQHPQRNNLIFDDLMKALETGRSPLILTERTEHLEELEKRLKGFAKNVFVLRGGIILGPN